MEEIDRDLIKKWLERGDIKRICKKHGVAESMAYNYLNGNSDKMKVECLRDIIAEAVKNKVIITGALQSL
jgi:hypothetical protein